VISGHRLQHHSRHRLQVSDGWRPGAQGNNERSHQTPIRFLDAYAPKDLGELSQLLARFREHYNRRRRHQALKVGHTHLTPAQTWEAGEHRGSDGTPIDIAELQGRAAAYKDGKLALDAAEPSCGTGGEILATAQRTQQALSAQTGKLSEQPEDLVQITRTNPQVYHRGRIFKVPTHLVGEHQLVTTATAFSMFSTLDGEESLYFPLPVRVASGKRLMPLWRVPGPASASRNRKVYQNRSSAQSSNTSRSRQANRAGSPGARGISDVPSQVVSDVLTSCVKEVVSSVLSDVMSTGVNKEPSVHMEEATSPQRVNNERSPNRRILKNLPEV
jgi:hypothetical protein